MGSYCQAPPYINAIVPPNIMLSIDVSGSMGSLAYQTSQEGGNDKYCTNNPSQECDDNADCSHDICQNDPSERCHDNGDCEHNTGPCVPPPGAGTCQVPATTATPYGYCSNALATSCRVDTTCPAGGTCIPRQVYEGYFRPDKEYLLDGTDSTYYEFAGSVAPCVTLYTYSCKNSGGAGCGAKNVKPADSYNTCGNNKYYCNRGNPTYTTGNCGNEISGNLLNYDNMARIDLLRWALTGGSPTTCTSSDIGKCDPRVYLESGMQAAGKIGSVGACTNTNKLDTAGTLGHGCILLTDNGKKVSVPWEGRVNDGLLFEFENLPVQPRIGAMFWSGTSIRSNYVYVGDFTSANSRTAYPFQNLLTEVNATDPNGYTPTGPAMWDILNYFRQTAPQYGGIPPQSGGGDNWKNPLYDCPDKGGGNCNFIPCTKNFVMLMSDGLWNQGGGPPAVNSCNINTGYPATSADPVVPSYLMHMGFTNAQAGPAGTATSITAVYSVGLFVSVEGEKSLQNVSIYGSFDKKNKTWPSNRTDYPGKQVGDPTNCAIATSGAACPSNQGTGSNCNALPVSSVDWDRDANGVADNYYYAADALTIKNNIMEAIISMLSHATSGTAASVLASGQGSGANLVQALFYPNRDFDATSSVMWTGSLQNLWYFLDPKTSASSIRENTADTGAPANTKQLVMKEDEVVGFYFDATDQKTKVHLWEDVNGDGSVLIPDTHGRTTIDVNDIRNLWEAGLQLWNKPAANRTIYVNISGTSTLPSFDTATLGTTPALQTLLNTNDGTRTAANQLIYDQNIVNYVRGVDFTSITLGTEVVNYRSRTTGTVNTATASPAQVYKLGDIINSTPRISSWVPLNNYNLTYKDSTYASFLQTTAYANRGLVFTGANDGMLHAFKLGALSFSTTGICSVTTSRTCTSNLDCMPPNTAGVETCKKFGLTSLTGTNLGEESWAFIPKNALPYLQYLSYPDYCHLYYVDLTPYVFDASIGSNTCVQPDYWNCTKTASDWRTILVGGMRLGGSCKNSAYAGTTGVIEPLAGQGYSSYFALDVTDQSVPPKLLWEYAPTDGSLGFTTTGPAIVRIQARKLNAASTASEPDTSKNGRWFAVFGSGPTGPITNTQFQGYSDQRLKLHILDLKTGALATPAPIDTGIINAFAGSMNNATIDYDIDYQDDALYFGYVSKCPVGATALGAATPTCASTDWTQGGVIRLVTNEDLTGTNLAVNGAGSTALDASNWKWSYLMKDIGAVASSVAHLAHYGSSGGTAPDTAYLYFGSGRYFFNTNAGADDPTSQRSLFGIQEPCLYEILHTTLTSPPPATCAHSGSASTVASPAATAWAASNTPSSWRIDLRLTTGNTYAERTITDPLAATNGAVFFTTFAPTTDVCSFGGNSYVWALRYDTGNSTAGMLKGKGLLQVSTGDIAEVDMRTAFGDPGNPTIDHCFGRCTTGFTGVPPVGQGLSVIVPPKPVDSMLHIRKK
ncbi:MAG: hypothetical protein C0402_01705 [Thermodesulfovibrio sp.]|nr:hypothetical protein [Thermodesulfovibrio sp.]